jgi:hypothetical protein
MTIWSPELNWVPDYAPVAGRAHYVQHVRIVDRAGQGPALHGLLVEQATRGRICQLHAILGVEHQNAVRHMLEER